jgi:DNA repair photolyase
MLCSRYVTTPYLKTVPMRLTLTETRVKSILTRTSGFLQTVCSHSLQPYRGCTFGQALCGVGCYVQHNTFLTRQAAWGSFLDARVNAADIYQRQYAREQRWARRARGQFAIFMSSSTDPFVPQEDRFRITRRLLEAMLEIPPDVLIIQTHTHRVTAYLGLYQELARACALRFHLSIESDRERLPGLPAPASSVNRRFEAAAALRQAGLRVVITVAPLLPIQDPWAFFNRVADTADAVVLDHFIAGDGTSDGSRTRRTSLPMAMAAVEAGSTSLQYRDRMVAIAQEIMPGRVGVSIDGFAGRFLPL